MRGLAHAVVRSGGRIFTQSAALRVARLGGLWSIDTPQGSVSAPLVIMATNAYTGALSEELRRTVVAVPSLQVATAPIPAPLRSTILPDGQAASDTWHLLRYFRLDASGRLVLGSRGTFAAVPTLKHVQYQYHAVHELYPQLQGIPFEYHWGGMVAITRDHLPHLHELAPGLLAGPRLQRPRRRHGDGDGQPAGAARARCLGRGTGLPADAGDADARCMP